MLTVRAIRDRLAPWWPLARVLVTVAAIAALAAYAFAWGRRVEAASHAAELAQAQSERIQAYERQVARANAAAGRSAEDSRRLAAVLTHLEDTRRELVDEIRRRPLTVERLDDATGCPDLRLSRDFRLWFAAAVAGSPGTDPTRPPD